MKTTRVALLTGFISLYSSSREEVGSIHIRSRLAFVYCENKWLCTSGITKQVFSFTILIYVACICVVVKYSTAEVRNERKFELN